MRQITINGDGKEPETFLAFDTQEEREDFFRRNKKDLKKRQEESLDRLRRAYMDGVKKIDGAYLRELGLLRIEEEKSRLESEIPSIPHPAV